MSEVAERYCRIAEGFDRRIRGVHDDQWDAPTPCPEFTVRQLVTHVVGTNLAVYGRLTGSDPDPVDDEADLVAQWTAARDQIASGLLGSRAQETVSGIFGEQPWESLVSRLLCADTLIHTWDLARATGQDEHLDPAAVDAAAAFLAPIDDAIRRPGGFAPKIDSPADADAQTRLLNFAGRQV
ncbi:MAG: TIGR03086 family metal-binding protein [Acidimicrobiales bacterium]